MPVLFSLSASRAMQFFGQSLVTAVSSALTPASNARQFSFDKVVAGLHELGLSCLT
jgi:hypothetical protein